MSKVALTTDRTFQKEVLESDLPVLVDFWADWCGPCKMLAPTIDAIAEELDGRLQVYKLNTDDNPATTHRYGVQGIPTLIFFSGGVPRGQMVGSRGKADILREIEHALGVKV